MQLESYIVDHQNTDTAALKLENSVLQTKVASLQRDYEIIKSKLLEDFGNKEMHIANLSETNQTLEEELKAYQEMSLSKVKQTSQKFNELEERIKELGKINKELEDKLAFQIKVHEEEMDFIKQDLGYAQTQLAQKKKENIRQMEKLEEERETNDKLRNHMNTFEERIKQLETENDDLVKSISTREKKIRNLSQEIHNVNEDYIESKDSELEGLAKEIKGLNSSLKYSKDQYATLLKAKEDAEEKYESLVQESAKKIENFAKEKKNLSDQISTLKQKYDILQQSSSEKEEYIKKSKDDTIAELQNRILELKQDKAELENALQELQDQIQITRLSSTEGISLNDELCQLRESYQSRGSTPRSLPFDFKKSEKISNELSEKELQIQILKAENATLKSSIENLVPNLMNKLPEYQALVAEKKRIETEFVLAKECWGNENTSLRNALEETEAIAINSNLKYAEAATDRDLYYKMYLDMKNQKNPPRKSWFKKK